MNAPTTTISIAFHERWNERLEHAKNQASVLEWKESDVNTENDRQYESSKKKRNEQKDQSDNRTNQWTDTKRPMHIGSDAALTKRRTLAVYGIDEEIAKVKL